MAQALQNGPLVKRKEIYLIFVLIAGLGLAIPFHSLGLILHCRSILLSPDEAIGGGQALDPAQTLQRDLKVFIEGHREHRTLLSALKQPDEPDFNFQFAEGFVADSLGYPF